MILRGLIALPVIVLAGCSAIPEVLHEPQYHNPLPQLSRIAVLPFYNQSADPTVDQDRVALAYYNELQKIPGFEVVPVGVTRQMLLAWQHRQMFESQRVPASRPQTMLANHQVEELPSAPTQKLALGAVEPMVGEEFQRLAQFMDVDAVVVGSVTEYSPYYPPRFGLSVRWYAANPGFYPIPPGYGLPWGTPEEEFIPEELVMEAEYALAREQLKTQTPATGSGDSPENAASVAQPPQVYEPGGGSGFPPDWPDPRGFIPPAPSPTRPVGLPQHEPVLTHTRLYHGNDADFTRRLANYYRLQDEARFGGWQGYLQRSEDFTRFCCHLHITEMLTARGGAGKTRVVWRWPIGRYEP